MSLDQLMARLQAGDKQAVGELLSRYGGGVYSRALSATNDKQTARRITRDTFEAVAKEVGERRGLNPWELYLDALTEKNIQSALLDKADVSLTGLELERAIFDASSPSPAVPPEEKAGNGRRESAQVRRNFAGSASLEPEGQGKAQGQRETFREKDDIESPRPPSSGRGGRRAAVAVGVITLLLCLWVLLGLAMRQGWLPPVDLGYSWFDAVTGLPLF